MSETKDRASNASAHPGPGRRARIAARGLAFSGMGMFLALAGGGEAAWACSCASTTRQALTDRASLAVVGRPIADGVHDAVQVEAGQGRLPPRRVTVFQMERAVKGRLEAERIAVLHRVDSAACGIVFDPKERYLLAFGNEGEAMSGPLRIDLCRIRRLSGERTERESG